MSFDEATRGSLTAGKIADFVVLSDDPLTAEHIENIQVKQLYLAGKPYTAKLRGVVGLLFRALYRRLFEKAYI